MKNTKKEDSIGDPRRFYISVILIFSLLLPMVIQPLMDANATVIDG